MMANHEVLTSNQDNTSSETSSPWDFVGNNQSESYSDSKHSIRNTVEIQNIEDLKQMPPIKQLSYLSSTIEYAEADAFYANFEAYKTFEAIENSDSFSPLIRIVASVGRSLNPNDERYDYESDVYSPSDEKVGYSTILRPEMIPDGVLTPEEESMSEDEIRLKLSQIKDDLDNGWSTVPDLEREDWILSNDSLINEFELALTKKVFMKNQEKLHSEFPTLSKNRQLVKIASNAAAEVEFNEKYGDEDWFSSSIAIGAIANKDGGIIKLDDETATYLSAVHQNQEVKNAVQEKLGISLTNISIESQIGLLRFMTEAGNERFDRLCDSLHSANKTTRLKLAENFLAADFGEDFGDALLEIAESEKLSNAEKERLLDTVGACRKSISRVTGMYAGFDNNKFAKEYARASNERLTDTLAVFQRIAKNGTAEADLDWVGKPRFDFDTAMEALELESKSLEIISGTLGDVAAHKKGAFAEVVLAPDKSDQRLNRTFYNFYSPQHGYVLLYTRPEGTHSFDPMIEYGKVRSRYNTDSVNAGAEASISLITNPVDPFSLPSPFRPDRRAVRNPRFYDPVTMDKVSAIRLDREGRAPGMAADDALRDPINSVGMVSVDLAAIGDRADTPSGKIARLLSVGGKLREEMSGVTSSLNHNTRWFDQGAYGTADGFSELVGYLDKMATRWCLESSPDDTAESFSRLMKRSRGRKVRRVA